MLESQSKAILTRILT